MSSEGQTPEKSEKKRGKAKIFIIIGTAALVLVLAGVAYFMLHGRFSAEEPVPELLPNYLYGIDQNLYEVEEGIVENGQTLSTLLLPYGIGSALVQKIADKMEPIFSAKNMRVGKSYTAFLTPDSLRTLDHFVYEKDQVEYILISIIGDSVVVVSEKKPVRVERKRGVGEIKSSLWNAMVDAKLPPVLAMDMSDMYAWSIDFFGLQEGDSFTVIYEEKFVEDTISLGIGRIWGAEFHHSGKPYYSFPFNQEGKVTYWDQDGNSLRQTLLKAPLKFSRISSTFSNSRLHPVLKIRRPHHGVDYAAPSGTPVHTVADGVVTHKGWAGGGGHTVKIKHSNNLASSYLHLSKYASGLKTGQRVSQGQLIGYVGSTGLSTGPHLDFRLYKNGKAIDPLKVVSEPSEPISKENRKEFEFVRDRLMAELKGELGTDLPITRLDSLELLMYPIDSTTLAVAADSLVAYNATTKTDSTKRKNRRRQG